MRSIFGQFGNIIDVVSRRTYKLRGQAWVVFENEDDAADALKLMQGFPFFNKPIVRLLTCAWICPNYYQSTWLERCICALFLA